MCEVSGVIVVISSEGSVMSNLTSTFSTSYKKYDCGSVPCCRYIYPLFRGLTMCTELSYWVCRIRLAVFINQESCKLDISSVCFHYRNWILNSIIPKPVPKCSMPLRAAAWAAESGESYDWIREGARSAEMDCLEQQECHLAPKAE